MTLRDEYLEFKAERGNMPFDTEGDTQFCHHYIGDNLNDFCRKIFCELMEIEFRLEKLEQDRKGH